jgi:hypothetical protein
MNECTERACELLAAVVPCVSVTKDTALIETKSTGGGKHA